MMSVLEPAMVKIRSDKIGENSAVGARSERPRNHDYLCTVIVSDKSEKLGRAADADVDLG